MATPPESDPNPRLEEEKVEKGEEDDAARSQETGNGGDAAAAEGKEDDDGEEDEEVEEEEEEEEEPLSSPAAATAAEREKLKSVLRRMSAEPVRLRVHDVVIKGNSKTKDELIEAEVLGLFRRVSTVQELVQAAGIANARLRHLQVFDAASVTLDAGPPELPGTANVIIEVVEAANPVTGSVGVYSKPEARSWSLEGSVKFKNLFGYADIWDASGSFGWDQTSEISAGLSLPRFKAISTPLMARVSLLSQDWLKFSSYKERLMGLSFGLISTRHHDLAYNLTWRTLTDPSRLSSNSIRRQLGHSLLSAIKYTYKIDQRDSHLRPTRGYAFLSSSLVGGLGDSRSVRFFRQEFDFQAALPLGFYNSAINIGVAAGAIMPWATNFKDFTSPLPERFYLGGHISPVCSLGGPSSLLGFRTRGLGPTEPRRLIPTQSDKDEPPASPGRDVLGGDLAVTAFADLSFDLPLKIFREAGIHGHMFVCAGNLAKLNGDELKNFSFSHFVRNFRSSAGIGIILPTKFFRVEINYCYILKQFEHDRGKTGIQFSFSSP
ncbi:sorting and assembly machinery component 50 homolog [Ananas comosus]|uniref:Sorting and assembly machinery component 50 homolog n=1 Tax=Ananas comosus TaxID=4615 RepID=A0A6P5GZG5_ANACO|nr:sorting and assembly machinery component 50 homolog [Ananas comosus]